MRSIEKIKDSGLILDVGCSTGFFLDISKKSGWQTFGIELGLKESKVARSKGHNVLSCSIGQANFSSKFDVITLWDVFEHISNPYRCLKELSMVLKKGGLIFLQIPNVGGLAPRLMQAKCNMFDGVEHCNLYNKATIEIVMKNTNYSIESVESLISEISVMNNYLDYEDPYFGSSKTNELLLGLIDEKMIHKNYLGYKFQIIIRC